jgi:hypothetical protein
MTDWRDPPEWREPPRGPGDEGDDDREPNGRVPQREPDMRDPEAQRAPGADTPGDEVIAMDAAGAGYEAVGTDNIREGRVAGVMGTPHASRGQGQGG